MSEKVLETPLTDRETEAGRGEMARSRSQTYMSQSQMGAPRALFRTPLVEVRGQGEEWLIAHSCARWSPQLH